MACAGCGRDRASRTRCSGSSAHDPVPPPPDMIRGRVRGAAAALGLLALVANLIVGSDMFGVRERLFGSATPPPRPPAFGRAVDNATAAKQPKTVLRSQPWWQRAAAFDGVRSARRPAVKIDGGAIQWRVRASCRSGRLVVRASAGSGPVLSTSCPATKTGFSTDPGEKNFQVTASGPWRMRVEQQIDVPLNEPPLRAMSARGARAVASGAFTGSIRRGRAARLSTGWPTAGTRCD